MVHPEQLNGREFDEGSIHKGEGRGAGGNGVLGAWRERDPWLRLPPPRREGWALFPAASCPPHLLPQVTWQPAAQGASVMHRLPEGTGQRRIQESKHPKIVGRIT